MRTKGTTVEIVAEQIVLWMEENPVPSTIHEISQGIDATYQTTNRAIKALEFRGDIINPTPLISRNVKYRLVNSNGERSKMPHYKGEDGKAYPVSRIYNSVKNQAQDPNRAAKWSNSAKNTARIGICMLFSAAFQSSQGEHTLARQNFTLARQNLVRARTQAAQDLAYVDSLLADNRLNPQKIASLIPILLEDHKYPVDAYKILHAMDDIMKMVKPSE